MPHVNEFTPGPRLARAALAALLALPLLAAAQSAAPIYTFITLAGTSSASCGSADGAPSAARFLQPYAVTVDSSGNVYVADSVNQTIRKIAAGGAVTTLAGSPGLSGSANGTGSAARFSHPRGIAVDSKGNLYIGDDDENKIRLVSPAGVVTAFAGSSEGSADGTGSGAQFHSPQGVALDSAGNLYVADESNFIIRKVTPSGVVTTVAGQAGVAGSADGPASTATFNDPTAVAFDSAGNLYIADSGNEVIRKLSTAGVVTTIAGTAGMNGTADGVGSAARFEKPTGVAVDPSGNVFVADLGARTIRKISPSGVVTTFAGSGRISGVDGTGTAAGIAGPEQIASDSAGNLFVADLQDNTIRKITQAGVVTTIAGLAPNAGYADGPAALSQFEAPDSVAVDPAGDLYVTDSDNNVIRKVSAAGIVSTLAGSASTSGDTDGTGTAATFNQPFGLAIDPLGTLHESDDNGNRLRNVTPAGGVATLAGGGRGTADGTGPNAQFNGPHAIALDKAGNEYVMDSHNFTLRKVTPAGVVSTLAGKGGTSGSADGTGSAARFNFQDEGGIGIDAFGNLYVADGANDAIRFVTATGVVTTLAGNVGTAGSADGTGSAASFTRPAGAVVDSSGNLFVCDEGNNTIRKVTPAGVVTTIAGTAGQYGNADGVGAAARFYEPQGITVDAYGNLYVADYGNDVIRMGILSVPPTITLQPQGGVILPNPTVGLSVTAAGSSVFSYQWQVNGAAIAGATASTYTAYSPGSYTVTVTNPSGSVTSSPAVVSGQNPDRLSNLSVNTAAGSSQVLTIGFVVNGGSGLSENLLIRASGPALGALGVTGFLADPTLKVLSGQTVVASNDNWGSPASNASMVTAADSATFAFPLTNPNSLDAALVASLPSSSYTAQISGNTAAPGTVVAEVYDDSGTPTANTPRLINLSCNTSVAANSSLTAGFVIAGPANSVETVLIRATGPALAALGVSGTMPDPQLALHTSVNGQDVIVASNSGWAGNGAITAADSLTGAFPLTNPASKDSALIVALPPGSYTAVASSASGAPGVVVIEVYEAP